LLSEFIRGADFPKLQSMKATNVFRVQEEISCRRTEEWLMEYSELKVHKINASTKRERKISEV
jgi:hypothetical protein